MLVAATWRGAQFLIIVYCICGCLSCSERSGKLAREMEVAIPSDGTTRNYFNMP